MHCARAVFNSRVIVPQISNVEQFNLNGNHAMTWLLEYVQRTITRGYNVITLSSELVSLFLQLNIDRYLRQA